MLQLSLFTFWYLTWAKHFQYSAFEGDVRVAIGRLYMQAPQLFRFQTHRFLNVKDLRKRDLIQTLKYIENAV